MPTGRRVVEWAREAEQRGAGEILLTSMDTDGMRAGFDCELTAAVSAAVQIPVIASGGAGTAQHFADVFAQGRADAHHGFARPESRAAAGRCEYEASLLNETNAACVPRPSGLCDRWAPG
jgi:phosphoribosylformimino-5-aminoimidazole carboxamide ribonucleotide (ProFAR) isomerase